MRRSVTRVKFFDATHVMTVDLKGFSHRRRSVKFFDDVKADVRNALFSFCLTSFGQVEVDINREILLKLMLKMRILSRTTWYQVAK